MRTMNLSSLISSRVGSNNKQFALVDKHKNVTYSDLICTFSNMFDKKVVLFINNTLELVKTLVLLDGCAKVICPISTEINDRELYHLISSSKFDAVISDLNKKDLEIFTDFNISIFKVSEIKINKQYKIESIIQNTTWLVPTSGTTSLPKLVNHNLATLATTSLRHKKVDAKHEIWGQFYDITRFAGYQILLNSLLNGHTLVTSSPADSIHKKVEWCSEKLVTHISATPSQWRKILMTGEIAKKIPLVQIVLGGEAADQKILDALNNFYPKAKITHTYASTEAGFGLSVSDQTAGFPTQLLNNSDGFSEILIRNEKLFIRSKSSASNYIDGEFPKDAQGWIDTGDIVKIEGNRFFIIGRYSGVINVGGDKVNPENVRQTLLKHPDIVQADVFGKKNPITGMVLSANIQLKNNAEEELVKISIKDFIKETLQKKDQPRIIKFVDDIELSTTGKLGAKI